MTISSRPAKRVALAAMIFSILFSIVGLLLGRWSGFFAVYAAGWLFLASVLIWLVLTIQFHQRTLAEQEKLDIGQLAHDEKNATIFKAEAEHEKLFAVAQRRLEILEKWFLPAFSILIAAFQIGIGAYLLNAAAPADLRYIKQPLLCAVCMAAVAFVGFLISKYATGMSTQPHWKPLRAGGSFLFGAAILSFALVGGLVLAQYKTSVVISVINYLLPILLIVLGVETALNIILDIYRPRLPGQYSRAAFDSRLLGIINEPGEILHTVAGAIDYQFGFKVSQTWFYKLLEKAIIPLLIFGAVTLYLLSCIVVVNPDEEAIIERFGNPLKADGTARLVEPGLAFKLPWPFGVAHTYPTKRIAELYIGFVPKTDPKTGQVVREPLLWTREHFKEEYSVLVASEQAGVQSSDGAAPVGLLKANVPVQYRVKNLYDFLYSHSDPRAHLESLCYRELARYAAGATIEVDDEAAIERSLLGAGRTQAKDTLTKNIQAAADKAQLGVEIVFVGLQGIHPPVEVAKDYQAVVGAVQKKQAAILQAEGERNWTLGTLAGSVEGASDLYLLAADYQRLRAQNDREKADQIAGRLDNAFAQAGGDIFAKLREAQAYRFEKAALARATGERFDSQVKAYRAAKDIYKREQRLLALEETLARTRKYVIVGDPNDTQTFMVDLKEKLAPSLYDLGGFQESSGQ